MANNSIALEVQPTDLGNSFAKGAALGQERQMNSMKMDMAQKEQGREEALQMMQMLGSAGMYALDGKIDGQADPAKWDEAMDGLAQFGFESGKYKGKPQLANVLVNASLSASDRIKMAQDDREFGLALQKVDQDLAQHEENMGIKRESLDIQRQRLAGGGQPPTGYRVAADGNLEFIPGGPADPKNKPTRRRQLTEGQAKTAGYAERMIKTEGLLTVPGEGGAIIDKADPGKSSMNPFSGDFYEGLNRKYGPQMTQSPEYQKFYNGAQEWVRAKLRKESGAAISASEWESEFQTYFPQPGDSKELIDQKATLRKTAIDSMIAESRGGYEELFNGTDTGIDAAPVDGETEAEFDPSRYEQDENGDWYEKAE